VQLYPHGTKFRLKLRTTATKVDVLAAVRRWIVIPRCNVTVTIDDGDPIRVGLQSPKQALEHLLAESMGDLIGKQKWRVAQRAGPGNLHRAISGVSA